MSTLTLHIFTISNNCYCQAVFATRCMHIFIIKANINVTMHCRYVSRRICEWNKHGERPVEHVRACLTCRCTLIRGYLFFMKCEEFDSLGNVLAEVQQAGSKSSASRIHAFQMNLYCLGKYFQLLYRLGYLKHIFSIICNYC